MAIKTPRMKFIMLNIPCQKGEDFLPNALVKESHSHMLSADEGSIQVQSFVLQEKDLVCYIQK